MASGLKLPGSLSSVVVVLVICTFAAHIDAHNKCPRGLATCRYGHKCKTNLWTDVHNCGECGHECPGGHDEDHATRKCSKGECKLQCDREWCNCDGDKRNGCEVNTDTDRENCGRCGKVCPTGASCVDGHCNATCASGLTECSGGCVNLLTDTLHCGTCGNVCLTPSPGVVLPCVGGVCGCFPGDATVTMANGGVKRMIDVELGDKVAVRRLDGSLVYEDIYAFGHRDASASASFVQLTVTPIDADMSTDPAVQSRTLELTSLHFVPVSSGSSGKLTYKRAEDVTLGDKMWAEGSSDNSMFLVTRISQVEKQGLFNPFTLGGTIIVNGVVASTHTEWFLDELFQNLGMVHWLPWAYQMVLLPVRVLYFGMGKDAYIALYKWLDSHVDVSAVGVNHGGSIVSTLTAASGVLVIWMMSKTSRRA